MVVVIDDIVIVDFGVDCGKLFEIFDGSFCEEWYEVEFDFVFFLEWFFVLWVEIYDWFYVDFVKCC